MKTIPETKDAPVLRTDFSDQERWEAVCRAIREQNEDGFVAYVAFIDDPAFDGFSKQQVIDALPSSCKHSFIIVVDNISMTDAEHPVLVVNLHEGMGSAYGDDFRALPSQVQGIENNLSIANMDFAEFAGAVDASGVFRGFDL